MKNKGTGSGTEPGLELRKGGPGQGVALCAVMVQGHKPVGLGSPVTHAGVS